jgi:hypothetical protein
MDATGITILPLFWIFHDQWAYRYWRMDERMNWYPTRQTAHRGHVHFFMSGLKKNKPAYSGAQIYSFSLENKWAQGSGDINQPENLRVIGTPKWYFHITEYWRRVYVQPWDSDSNPVGASTVGKKGVKYDASASIHTMGPFRETRDNFFYWTNMARTLPVEYFLDDKKFMRNHYIKTKGKSSLVRKWDTFPDRRDLTAEDQIIPDTYWAGDGEHDGPAYNAGARRSGYPDSMYIYPTIEYQEVVHKNWERLYGWQDRDINERSSGDGFDITVSLPFVVEGVVQSPFSANGKVSPFGAYHHDFEIKFPSQIPTYPTEDLPSEGEAGETNEEWNIPEELLGQPVVFRVPNNMPIDGEWVEQCLGGIVHAKAEVTLEDNFGGRSVVIVDKSQFMVRSDFEGVDQNTPPE